MHNLHDMELAWIEDFLALHKTGNFTRAAEMRHTTQPAFSRRIQQLEYWAGAPLFNRESRPVTLTAAGTAFLNGAQKIREEILDARRVVKNNVSALQNPARIYTVNTLAQKFIPNFIKDRGLENISLSTLSITGVIEALRRGRADYGLIPRFSDDLDTAGLPYEIVGKDRLMLVESKAKPADVYLKNKILHGRLLSYKPGTAIGSQINALLKSQDISFSAPPVLEAEAAESLVALVEEGYGAAWIPEFYVNRKLAAVKGTKTLRIPYTILWLSGPH